MQHIDKFCGILHSSSWVLKVLQFWIAGLYITPARKRTFCIEEKPEGDKNTKKQMSKRRVLSMKMSILGPVCFSFPSPYLWLLAVSMPGLSYCLCLGWDQIRPCCQLAQPVLFWKSCLQPFSRVHMSIPIAHDNRDSAGLQQPLCWYQKSCRRQVTAEAEASCLSDTGGKKGGVYFCLLLCFSTTSSAY